MKAIRIHEPAETNGFVYEEAPDPTPVFGDVLVKVAEQTVQARQVVANQIQALENAKLRSALDVSFANVALAQAQLLLVNANNNRGVAYAILSEALGLPNEKPFELVDTAPAQPPAPLV